MQMYKIEYSIDIKAFGIVVNDSDNKSIEELEITDTSPTESISMYSSDIQTMAKNVTHFSVI